MQRALRHLRAWWLTTLLLLASLGCFVQSTAAAEGEEAAGRIHSITLPHFEPELPIAPGRSEYLAVCVSCHSPRYVTMQPFFPRRQWEETVDKMVKVYGAQMDPPQRTSIVQYLVATHGPESAQAGNDDDSDFAPMSRPARVEIFPSLTLAQEGPLRSKQIERGAELFQQNCAGCHGPAGRGDGFVARVLLRQPKDLAASRFSVVLLSQVLWNGKPGTAMPSWRGLAQADLQSLAGYVLSLHEPTRQNQPSIEALQRGNQVFQKNCAPCHGEQGEGNGPAATNLLPQPANFKLKQPEFDYILQVVSQGIAGTAMPAWNNQISQSDLKEVANFIRSLFQPVTTAAR